MPYGSFEDLEVWKRSCVLSVEINKSLLDCSNYALKDQMIRAAISIPSNIAEGSERGTSGDYTRFLRIAKGSAAELRTQTYIAQKLDLISNGQSKAWISELIELSKMLQALINSLNVNK